MIQFRNLSFSRGARTLVEDASLQFHDGQKIGLVGANGTGKSSLFALLRGELHQDRGDLEMPPTQVIAHVGQETPALPDPALEFVLDGDAELRTIERDLAAEEALPHPDGHRLALLHERLDHAGGYSARARASALLSGLGFGDAEFMKPVAEFSGGWRVRLNLARALMCRSDLLLLDEPTNHLDMEAVIWLEGWLKSYPGTLLLISHDREFLDNTIGTICHLEGQRLKLYTGNYADFERQRAAQLALQQAMYTKQRREVEHLEDYIRRFRAKATKARQAQSRIKALARMEELAPAHVDTPFTFTFREPLAAPDPLLLLDEAACGYGDKVIASDIRASLRPGSRIGLLGPNGAGKSTLIRLLAGIDPPLAGKRQEGKGLTIGYFAQHQLEQLRPEESPLQHMIRRARDVREQELRDYLGGFGFIGDMATSPVAPFSGGEKSRLALALLIWGRPNLLLLDEPTNHLDLEMRHALTLALQDFEGALVLVSHDRHLLRTTTDDLWLVAEGKATPFDGDLEDYREWLALRRAVPAEPEAGASQGTTRKEQRQQEAQARQQLAAKKKPLQKELEKLEKSMAAMESEKSALDVKLSDPALYQAADKAEIQSSLTRQAQLAKDLEAAEERWLELHEQLEAMDNA